MCDGKGETNVDITRYILSHISQKEGKSILNNVSCYMTDRSATEQKVNGILARDIDHSVHSFKCSDHPLSQFFDVCIEEIFDIEQELCFKCSGYTHSLRESFFCFF